ncbi:putative AP2/ERF and B3 domain-containing protein Os01g0140700 [Miscanthus floridulus]|uniref:putative AP2/ERF and B3 domain-containing protein Os01g0140700 n=1 Tax=Miscanthus floridulus TaxID=154761 RepID=UPI00345A6D65
MSFSKLSAAATYTAAMMESSTKMALAAIDGADVEVAEQQLPPSRFINGVMLQPSNGRRCGAQTYERPIRKWMSTFPEEETPARGYDDLAAPARRCQRGVANFSAECATDDGELAFQPMSFKSVTVKTTLQMQTSSDEVRPSLWQAARAQPATTWVREHLFQKALTPSDVGKLNRLVVPKHHAEKHLFLNRNPMMAARIGMLIDFVDGSGKTWRFRYSFSATSRMYVITKGWRRFVREKGLQAGDTVAFSRLTFGAYKQMQIDYWKTQKKPEDAKADAIAVDCHAVMLFGVDIATA